MKLFLFTVSMIVAVTVNCHGPPVPPDPKPPQPEHQPQATNSPLESKYLNSPLESKYLNATTLVTTETSVQVVLIATTLSSKRLEDPCSSFEGQYIYLYEESKTWDQAVSSCEAKGKRLAVPRDPAAFHAYLQRNQDGERFWLGGSDKKQEGMWTWINGPSMAGFPWGPDQPDDYNGNEDCLEWGYGGNFNDDLCTNAQRYICEPVPWRDDSRCGCAHLAPNGLTGQCNPASLHSCCSPHGWCGETDDHCKCDRCVDYSEGYHTAHACESKELNIACAGGNVIDVTYANYGRTSNDICNDSGRTWPVNCRSGTSLQVLTDRCNGQRSCNVAASNSIFGDPCGNVHKYLEVQYACVLKPDYSNSARKYAPKLRFDSQQGKTNKCFPSSASDYHYVREGGKGEGGNNGRICNTNYDNIRAGKVPTYYKAQECGPHLYISYWVFYGYQDCCGHKFGKCQGAHDLDWEHINVKVHYFRTSSEHLDAVQYYQHKGFYSRHPGKYERHGTHPIVYIGKNSHGSYHDQGGTNAFGLAGCTYYGDYRKPGDENKFMETWLNLQDFMDELDPNIVEVMNSRHLGDTPKKRNINLCDLKGCRGKDSNFWGEIKGCDKSHTNDNQGF